MNTSARPTWEPHVRALWARVLQDAPQVEFREVPGQQRHFRVEWAANSVRIDATDPSSACVAIHRFLRASGCWVTWDTELPIRFRSASEDGLIEGTAQVDHLYDLNFCTFGYTTPYWSWSDWEKEIDWMALHGVTMPLALVGHEAVLVSVYTNRGMTTDEVLAFLGDPIYFPWVAMGCVDSIGEPISADSLDQRIDLGRQIVERQRELGMTPVFPGFVGHVPSQIAGDEGRPRHWQGVDTLALPSESRLLRELASEVVSAQIDLFGTDHLYACDPFVETVPDDNEVQELAESLFNGMRDGDVDAVWVLQSWPFSYQDYYWTTDRVAEFLTTFPADGLMLLDLYAEAKPQWLRFNSFKGRSWVWCGLLDFGGRTDLIADLPAARDGIRGALNSPNPPIGLGLSMEAIHVTAVFFEFISDNRWTVTTDTDNWLAEYGRGRYVTRSLRASNAWKLLGKSVLRARAEDIFPEKFVSTVVLKPSFELVSKAGELAAEIEHARDFDTEALLQAWRELFLLAQEEPDLIDGALGDDLVSVGQAVLVKNIDDDLGAVLAGAQSGHFDEERFASALSCFADLDELASCRPSSRLSTWEQEAGDRAASARMLLTKWASSASADLGDYSARLWAGLVSGYYAERWRIWGRHLAQALSSSNGPPDEVQLNAELEGLTAEIVSNGVSEREPAAVLQTTSRLIDHWGDRFAHLGADTTIRKEMS